MDTSERLGRYELLEEIGRGAMGVVYLAQDPLIGRRVALKIFRVGFSASDDELHNLYARFIREAQSAGILSHPNIVTVHDVGQAEGDQPAFIAMEYVEGRTLKEILDSPEPIDRGEALELVAQVAKGLDYAHSMGVVHRDIKPGNILVGAERLVKITDFGIAQVNVGNITNHGQLLGTPNYMAPEVIQEQESDHRADLFSLGVVLYELVTRHKPFTGENMTQVTHRIVYEPFTPPGRIVHDLPGSLEAIIARCLEKDPRQRFQAAAELELELERAKDDVRRLPATESFDVVDESTAPVDTRSVEVAARPRRSRAVSPGRRLAGWLRRATPIAHMPVWLVGTGLVLGVLGGYLLARAAFSPAAVAEAAPRPVAIWRPLLARAASLEATARERLSAGDLEGAAAALAEAVRLDPGSRRLADELEQVESRARVERERRDVQVREHLDAARRSLDDGRIRDAVEYAGRAMSLDPMSLEGPELVAAAERDRQRIVARREAMAEPVPAPRTPAPEPRPEPLVESKPAQPVAAEPVPTTASLTVHLTAQTSPGVLTVYANDEQIVRERFRFVEDRQGGFLRSLTARPGAGELELHLERSPGLHSLRVYVSMPGEPTQVSKLERDLEAGGRYVLAVDVAADGSATVHLQ